MLGTFNQHVPMILSHKPRSLLDTSMDVSPYGCLDGYPKVRSIRHRYGYYICSRITIAEAIDLMVVK